MGHCFCFALNSVRMKLLTCGFLQSVGNLFGRTVTLNLKLSRATGMPGHYYCLGGPKLAKVERIGKT